MNEICWLIRRDLPRVLEIERGSFANPWSQEDFEICTCGERGRKNCIGMVVSPAGTSAVSGFLVYELHKRRLRILNLAVAPESRRKGFGGELVKRLIEKLSQQRRNEIVLELRETNLTAQLFYRAMGFQALCVLRQHYDDGEDGYVMRYRLHEPPEEFALHNRISQYYEDPTHG